ncbi:site-specific DNA-methyltransferase, partial [Shinella sp.]|uniref:DNA-methyltransferase n=1 Tax=Shinella sp. TaxID=1870904 RepID=UPI00258398EC
MTDCILERPPAQTDLFTQFLAARHADGIEHVVSGRERQSECPRADTGPIRVGACEVRHGDALAVLPTLPAGSVDLIVTSPPYNVGKSYETRTPLTHYIAFIEEIIGECHRLLGPRGAISWQVGNHVHKGEVIPIDSLIIPLFRDLGMKVRNRVAWTFGHGLHRSKRLSGRHETIVWATKSHDYTFDLDAIRVPQKYPGKRYYKGPKKGDLSGNPKGKNPGDVWDISNVKHNHLEKLDHP